MKEAIIAQVIVVFCKAIKKFAKKNGYEEADTSLMLRLNDSKTLDILICHLHNPVKPTTAKDVMGMTLSFSGLGGMIVQYIEQILLGFRASCGTEAVDILVYLDRNDDENINLFLYADSKFVRQFYLEEVLTI